MYFNQDDFDGDAVFNGVEWVTYQQAVDSVTEKDECYSLLECLLEASHEQPTAELVVSIKTLVEKMFPSVLTSR
jgi:hypothetical protein